MLNILGRSHDHGFDEPLELLADCHRRVEKFLDILCRLSRERNGGPLEPAEAEAMLGAQRYFAHAAPRHTADEEESLFPRMKAAAEAKGRDCPAIVGLQDDHARADQMHARVDALLSDWLREGTLAGDHAAALTSLVETLRELYRGHIRVEEAVVFPLAAELLSASDLTSVGLEMRARRGLRSPE